MLQVWTERGKVNFFKVLNNESLDLEKNFLLKEIKKNQERTEHDSRVQDFVHPTDTPFQWAGFQDN